MISNKKSFDYVVLDPICDYIWFWVFFEFWISKSKNTKCNYGTTKKVVNYKLIDLKEIYNFDVKFVFILHVVENLWFFLLHLFLEVHIANSSYKLHI